MAILWTGISVSLGAVLYAVAWPGRRARLFGYHEIFHLTVIAHLGVHVWVVAKFALRVF
jgi:hemolysin III